MSRPHRQRARRVAGACLLLLLSAGCTETDELLVENVGVTRLFLTDTSLRAQRLLFNPFNDIQVAEWRIEMATLDIDGALVPLVTDADCTMADTVLFSPVADGPCATGVVVETSAGQPFDILLSLSIQSMEVRRGAPLDLSLTEDHDGDGVRNNGNGGSFNDAPCGPDYPPPTCDDNCPLVWNPDQADSNEDGVGNACTTTALDSDADGVFDGLDNCVAIANPGQEDTTGPLGGLVPDGIGDACVEQAVTVTVAGASSFDLLLGPAVLNQPLGVTTFITVDFDSDQALSCDWDALSCVLDPTKILLCTHSSIIAAVGGC